VYRNQPLPISETFVYNQSVLLDHFEAFFLGAKRPAGPRIELPPERLYLINEGGIAGWGREAAFKLLGYLPRDLTAWVHGVGPVLVHAHFGPDGAVVLPLAGRLRLPLIVSFHGYDATTKDEFARRSHVTHRLYLRRRERLCRQAARVIVQSEFLKGKVIAVHGFPEEKVGLSARRDWTDSCPLGEVAGREACCTSAASSSGKACTC
jgi:glycosyltransferase involved in cell wall biosynthesis